MAVEADEAPFAPRGAGAPTPIDVKGAIGYAWTLADAETAHAIRAALRRAGTGRVVIERLQHTASPAPQLAELVACLRPGDVITVPDLARLAPRLRGLLNTVAAIEDAGAALVSLGDGIDGRTAASAGAIRAMLALRRHAPAAPRGSRSRGLSDKGETELLDAVRADPLIPTATLAMTFGISPSTVRRLLKRAGYNRSPGRIPGVQGFDQSAN
nr:recombinase family protein [Jannaschia sp. Os4]